MGSHLTVANKSVSLDPATDSKQKPTLDVEQEDDGQHHRREKVQQVRR